LANRFRNPDAPIVRNIDNHTATTSDQGLKTLPSCQNPVAPSGTVCLTIKMMPMFYCSHRHAERLGQFLGLPTRKAFAFDQCALGLEGSKLPNSFQPTTGFEDGLRTVEGL
jgi:hypothetical protein